METFQDHVIWELIGGEKFCSFKYYSGTQYFCKNDFNLMGFCSRQYCPLSNSRYATIIEKNGEFYLYIKDKVNSRFPDKVWKKFSLSRNFTKSFQELDSILNLWPKLFVYKTKYRLTKLRQISIREKLDAIKKHSVNKIKKKKIAIKQLVEYKTISKLNTENLVEKELLHRFNLGIYGNLYPTTAIRDWKTRSVQPTNLIAFYEKKIKTEKIINLF